MGTFLFFLILIVVGLIGWLKDLLEATATPLVVMKRALVIVLILFVAVVVLLAVSEILFFPHGSHRPN